MRGGMVMKSGEFSRRYLAGDIKAHKGLTVVLVCLVALSSALMGVGAGTIDWFSSTVAALHTETSSPDLLQMH
ncbi:MAG: hypothetical protein Q4A31_12240 [Corynebacterium sp.]|uniref:hypothetical protein n=1 Tax=Corynebacterium sp. TaxID=1720 RepID=UPI0026DD7EB4|nr:hypothetical protein [Corynebacterium sp.]MDO4762682.1 hypothetical protein [Corynebacterium sp.]